MKDLESRTVLVTGASDGLGRGVARALAARGAELLVHGRDAARTEAVAGELRAHGAAAVRVYLADLASLAEVRRLAAEVRAREPRLHVLVNNAGIGTTVPTSARAESADGIELRFAVNYLSHYLLTRELLPLLRASAPARIVNVSSIGQTAIDFDDPMLTRGYSGMRAYCQSKLAQIMFTIDLAAELAGTSVTVNALHPATYMPTKIVAHPTSTLAEGVDATVRLVTDPALAATTGKFFDGTRESNADRQAYDPAAREKLRALSARLVGVGASGHTRPG
ncbi:MAG TPA: SDR family NAD(P)-dependent oxidoreductase [Polyangia bacterium]|jgi:NAD(P)-dependent dehydrogenase (short-subunit alcohol dehydrogenase family)|nr:SDR family NAD(P)-dependent oxidoreductase [Polyangia bacterium]